MPPIPVHSSSPISPIPTVGLVAHGVIPSTAAAEARPSAPGDRQRPAAAPATTTGRSLLQPRQAQPGAPAGLAPTSRPTITASRYTPTPTATASSIHASSSPPPPQPGAVPSPTQAPSTQRESRHPSIPPPPKAGEIARSAAYGAPQYEPSSSTAPAYASSAPLPRLSYLPQQPSLSAPTRAQPPASMTSTPHDLSHPPGYVQDTRASFEERPLEPYRPFANGSDQRRTPSSLDGGILDPGPKNYRQVEGEEKSMWGEAVSWAKTVGGKVVEGEEALWKRINGQR